MRPQSSASSSARCAYSPFRFAVRIWYVAMVTGLISLIWPEYSPISSAVSDVRLSSSSRHCRALTVLVTRISVVVLVSAIARGADERLAGAAGQHDDARAALGEDVDGLALVRPQVPAVLGEVDRMRRARRVAGAVLGRPADLQQLLLDVAARPRVDDERVGGGVADQQRLDALVLRHLGQHRGIRRSQHQARRRRSRSMTRRP